MLEEPALTKPVAKEALDTETLAAEPETAKPGTAETLAAKPKTAESVGVNEVAETLQPLASGTVQTESPVIEVLQVPSLATELLPLESMQLAQEHIIVVMSVGAKSAEAALIQTESSRSQASLPESLQQGFVSSAIQTTMSVPASVGQIIILAPQEQAAALLAEFTGSTSFGSAVAEANYAPVLPGQEQSAYLLLIVFVLFTLAALGIAVWAHRQVGY